MTKNSHKYFDMENDKKIYYGFHVFICFCNVSYKNKNKGTVYNKMTCEMSSSNKKKKIYI
jgi:hypothetical protein